ncbi:2501_t:CDS:2, partial [Entrophospora sp. SA101]
SGGLGINLTGADTVIFYDSDWNPCADRQCQDRCHRIGQTREVNIYRFVSEHTIEENILLKANQKRMLDKLVIMDGEFTTDFFQKVDWRALVSDIAPNCSNEIKDEPKDGVELEHYLDKVEDDTDVNAAKISRNEFEIDIPDFSEDYVATELSSPIKINGINDDNPDHIDNYMLLFIERELA